MTGVEIGDNTLAQHLDVNRLSSQWFTAFPHHLVAGNEQAKRALLTLHGCDNAYVCFKTLIEKLLEGTYRSTTDSFLTKSVQEPKSTSTTSTSRLVEFSTQSPHKEASESPTQIFQTSKSV